MEQAARAAEQVSMLPRIDSLYSSPILRARQTADIISKHIGIEPVIDERLRERWFGVFEGKEMPQGNNEWKLDPNNGVLAWEELRSRVRSFIDDAIGKTVVAVSHGDNIAAALDLIDDKGARFHGEVCPKNCNFVVIDSSRNVILAEDVSRLPGDIGLV